jgi:YHS domain-containing protein
VSPIKILVIAILLYIGYRLLISDWRKKKGKDGSAQESPDRPVTDVLVEDPICHKLVPKQQAIRLKQKNQEEIIYFCSEECCNRFVSQEGEKE